jgi:ribosomal protein L11
MTKDWKGIKVMIQLTVLNREAKCTLMATAAARVIKAMAEPARDRKKVKIRKHDEFISHRKAPSRSQLGSSYRNCQGNQRKQQG